VVENLLVFSVGYVGLRFPPPNLRIDIK
jgi:hypothetical protein